MISKKLTHPDQKDVNGGIESLLTVVQTDTGVSDSQKVREDHQMQWMLLKKGLLQFNRFDMDHILVTHLPK